MERFVQLIVASGLALVAGLWLLGLLDPSPVGRVLAGLLVLAGVAGLAAGIRMEVDVRP